MQDVPTTYIQNKIVGTGANRRSVQVTKTYKHSQIALLRDSAGREFNSKISKLGKAHSIAYQQTKFNIDYPDVTSLGGTWFRQWQSNPLETSLSQKYERELTRRGIQRKEASRSSITTAYSDAVIARNNNQQTIKEFEVKRYNSGKQLNAGLEKLIEIKNEQKALKSRPKIVPMSYSATLEKTPISIIGTTPELSKKAVNTFKETEFQHQKLFKEITEAKDYIQTIRLKESAQLKNPYVGTPQSLLYKGRVIDSSGVLIEKKLNSQQIITYEPIADSTKKPKEIPIDVMPTPNIPLPKIEKSIEVPSSFDYVFENEKDYIKDRTAEEIRIAGGTYGDYLKTINQNSLENQLKLVAKGSRRGFNSYASLIGAEFQNPNISGHSLIDLVYTDIYNSIYAPIIKPNKSILESMGIKVAPAPANPKPFEQSSKAFNQRTPAENAGDIITVGAIEAGIFLTTAGLGNLVIKGASKLPYLLKAIPKTPKQVIKAELQTKTIHLPGMGKVKLTNFDYIEPGKRATKIKKINPAPGIPLKTIKVGGKKINVIDFDAVPKTPGKKTPGKKTKHVTNTKLGRLLAQHTPSTEPLSKIKSKIKDAIPKELDVQSKVINTKFVRGASKLGGKPRDKGKAPKGGESAWELARKESEFATKYSLPAPGQTTTEISQYLKLLQKKPTKVIKTIVEPKKPKKQLGDMEVVETFLHANRPKIRDIPLDLGSKTLVDQGLITGQLNGIKESSIMKLTEKTDSILNNLLEQKSSTASKLKDKNKDLQKLLSGYSLLVTPGKQSNRSKSRNGLKQDTRIRALQKSITKIKKQPKLHSRIPAPIRVTTISNNPNTRRKSKKRKHNVKYSIWNVDVKEIGVLPGIELEVSKSTKVFKKLDARQKKAHAKPTKRKSAKSTKKSTRKTKSNQR